MTRHLIRGVALALFAALLAAPAAFAQETAPPPAPPPTDPQPQQQVEVDLTDDELDSFAEAYLDIEQLQASYEQQLGAVDDPAQAQEIQQQFNDEAMQTLETSGIGAERYDEIIRAAQTDPELADNIVTRLDEMRATN